MLFCTVTIFFVYYNIVLCLVILYCNIVLYVTMLFHVSCRRMSLFYVDQRPGLSSYIYYFYLVLNSSVYFILN